MLKEKGKMGLCYGVSATVLIEGASTLPNGIEEDWFIAESTQR
jgi:hypothetical protein